MKKLLLLILVIPYWLLGQWTDDFSQNNINSWSGDTAHYQTDSLQRLQLFAPYQSSTSTIYHHSEAILNGKWELEIQMDFNPSSSNYCDIYLSIDQNKNGYFVRLGGTDDEVCLYKTTNSQSSKIIDGINDFLDLDSVKISVKVERDSIGNWQLWAKKQEWELQAMLSKIRLIRLKNLP
jgi:hypothetical protein